MTKQTNYFLGIFNTQQKKENNNKTKTLPSLLALTTLPVVMNLSHL